MQTYLKKKIIKFWTIFLKNLGSGNDVGEPLGRRKKSCGKFVSAK